MIQKSPVRRAFFVWPVDVLINKMNFNNNNQIRVRFAPSPTGHLHIGGARTALYNWLFARGHSGVFILRIEDTDLSRSTEQAINQIINSMRWLGLDWDEGPETGGIYGPYRQMERLDLYRSAAERLLAEDKAYYCYCTHEELEEKRRQARSQGRPVIYQGCCRNLSAEEGRLLREEGRQPVLRLKTPASGITVVRDIIKGDVKFENAQLGDFILMRSSGVPTYNFAVSVDDAAMKISHVIRGDDHLPNTPRQLLLMEALGFQPPVYAHLPLILGADRAPLSKRHGAVSVEEFRSRGFVREALCNYLALLGWSYDSDTNLFSIAELTGKFSLERVGATAAAFDEDKLTWMNGHYIRNLPAAELAGRIEEFLSTSRLAGLPGRKGKPGVTDLVPLVQEKMKTLADFISLTDFFFLPIEFEAKSLAKLEHDANSTAILRMVSGILRGLTDFSVGRIEEGLRQAAAEMEIKLGKFLQPVRIAVSGKLVTPGMFETLAVLGRQESVSRIETALAMLEAEPKDTN